VCAPGEVALPKTIKKRDDGRHRERHEEEHRKKAIFRLDREKERKAEEARSQKTEKKKRCEVKADRDRLGLWV
jgi:hypothetical protein